MSCVLSKDMKESGSIIYQKTIVENASLILYSKYLLLNDEDNMFI
jgi:hypothetical protein